MVSRKFSWSARNGATIGRPWYMSFTMPRETLRPSCAILARSGRLLTTASTGPRSGRRLFRSGLLPRCGIARGMSNFCRHSMKIAKWGSIFAWSPLSVAVLVITHNPPLVAKYPLYCSQSDTCGEMSERVPTLPDKWRDTWRDKRRDSTPEKKSKKSLHRLPESAILYP